MLDEALTWVEGNFGYLLLAAAVLYLLRNKIFMLFRKKPKREVNPFVQEASMDFASQRQVAIDKLQSLSQRGQEVAGKRKELESYYARTKAALEQEHTQISMQFDLWLTHKKMIEKMLQNQN